jgi:capsular exopolysaccharide synthesis family protein
MAKEIAGYRASFGDEPMQVPPAGPQAGLTFLIDVLRRWWGRLLVFGLGVGIAAGGAGYVLWTPSYESEAVLIVNPSLVFSQDHFDSLQFSKSQLEVIKSPAVLEPALEDERVKTILAERGVVDSLAWVRKRLTPTVMGESQLFVVKVKAEDPESPPPIVDAICKSYLTYFANDAADSSRQKIDTIKATIGKIEAKIVQNEKEIDSLSRQAAAAGSVAGRIEVGGVRIADQMQGDLHKARREANRIAAEIDEKRRVALTLPSAAGEHVDGIKREVEVNADSIRRVRGEIAELPRTSKTRRSALDRELERLVNEKAALDANLKAVILAEEIGALQRKLDGLRLEERTYVAEIAKEQGIANENVKAYLRMKSIQDETQAARQLADDLNRKLTNLEMDNPVERVRLMKGAAGPAKRTEDGGPIRRAALVGLAGALLPALLVFLKEYMTQRIGSSVDLAKIAPTPIIGEIAYAPAAEARPTGRYQLSAARFHESVDYLRISILSSQAGKDVRAVAVVSALSGEGKSTLSANLAKSFVEGCFGRVLLVDGDMRCPTLHKTFRSPLGPGLADMLARRSDFRSTIRRTLIERLDFLPAGEFDGPVAGLFVADNFRLLVDRLRESYDFIVVDTPPILPVGDALMIGDGVDGVVFCALRDKSDAGSVAKARQRLANAGIKVLGAVLNGSPDSSFGSAAYYYARNGKATAQLPAPT